MAEQLQVLDVLLFKFIILADSRAKVPGLTNGEGTKSCGYVSRSSVGSTTAIPGGKPDEIQSAKPWSLGDVGNTVSRHGSN